MSFTCEFCGEELKSAFTKHTLLDCAYRLKAEVERLRDENATLRETWKKDMQRLKLQDDAEARVAELDYALDEAVKDLGNLVAAFNKTSPMEQPWGTKELAVIKGDLIRRYHTAHPDAEEGA